MSKINNKLDYLREVGKLTRFLAPFQIQCLHEIVAGEERQFAYDTVANINKTVNNMPITFETDGQGDAAIAHLHYFNGSMDCYITEKDMEKEQQQAFGLVSNQFGLELGYINIEDLKSSKFEMDFHFEPVPLSKIREQLTADVEVNVHQAMA